MLRLDGSYGEGGGQILRTSLSLSAMLGTEFRLEQIRAGRPRPGLRPQHLTAVRALARITRAEVAGAELHSRELTFKPRLPQAGHYLIDVAEKSGSAGSVTLIAQAQGPSTLITSESTSHLLTNLWVIEQFLGPTFQIKGNLGERGEIFCQGEG